MRGLMLLQELIGLRLDRNGECTRPNSPFKFGIPAALAIGLGALGRKTTWRSYRSVQSPCKSTRAPRFRVNFLVTWKVSPAYTAEYLIWVAMREGVTTLEFVLAP